MAPQAGRAASPEPSSPRAADGTWPHQLSHAPIMRVGDVLAALQPEFPALTTSKLRYFDAEGLVRPARTDAGYRHYSAADVERLRFVLTQQRDRYAPLTVIAHKLRELDAGERTEAVVPRTVAHPRSDWLTARELAAHAGVTTSVVDALAAAGVIQPGLRGHYARALVGLVHAAGEYLDAGADVRELRGLLRAAEREAQAAVDAVAPLRARGRDQDAAEDSGVRIEAAVRFFAEAARHHRR